MVGLVKLMGIVIVIFGTMYFVKPSMMKTVINFWIKDNRVYMGAVLSIVIGIIFFLAASRCTLPWFVVIVGLLSLIKGFLIFVLGPKKIITLTNKITKTSLKNLRTLAAIALVIGIFLIYSA